VASSLYDVALTSSSIEVRRDGKLLFAADSPVEIRRAEFASGAVRSEARSERGVKLRVSNAPAREFRAGVEKGSARWCPGEVLGKRVTRPAIAPNRLLFEVTTSALKSREASVGRAPSSRVDLSSSAWPK
jgi:hypothetical protein